MAKKENGFISTLLAILVICGGFLAGSIIIEKIEEGKSLISSTSSDFGSSASSSSLEENSSSREDSTTSNFSSNSESETNSSSSSSSSSGSSNTSSFSSNSSSSSSSGFSSSSSNSSNSESFEDNQEEEIINYIDITSYYSNKKLTYTFSRYDVLEIDASDIESTFIYFDILINYIALNEGITIVNISDLIAADDFDDIERTLTIYVSYGEASILINSIKLYKNLNAPDEYDLLQYYSDALLSEVTKTGDSLIISSDYLVSNIQFTFEFSSFDSITFYGTGFTSASVYIPGIGKNYDFKSEFLTIELSSLFEEEAEKAERILAFSFNKQYATSDITISLLRLHES